MPLLILLLVGCSNKDQSQKDGKNEVVTIAMTDYHWLEGVWLAHGLEYFEEWKTKDDSTMLGRAYKLEGIDTSITEEIIFTERGGVFTYTPTVKSQNQGRPIVFTGVTMDKSQMVFENLKHDFPNRIIYFLTSDQQIDVRIEQVIDGNVGQTYDIIMSRME